MPLHRDNIRYNRRHGYLCRETFLGGQWFSADKRTENKKLRHIRMPELFKLRYKVGSENLIILLQLCTSYRELCAILNNDNAVVLDELTILGNLVLAVNSVDAGSLNRSNLDRRNQDVTCT